MRLLIDLSNDIKQWGDNVERQLINAQRRTAQSIAQDVVNNAPVKTGKYVSSIKISDTEYEENIIKTSIYTDYNVMTKNGKEYNLGFLLENGTGQHAIPNAFGWGDIFGYDSPQYERTTQNNWHPGFAPIPHWQPALNKNIITYNENIRKAIYEGTITN